MDVLTRKKTAIKNTVFLSGILYSLIIFGQENISGDIPVYTPQEAVEILRGNKVPEKRFYMVDYDGKFKERSEAQASNLIPGDHVIEVPLESSRMLEGEAAAASATAMFLNRVNYEIGSMDDANVTLLALKFNVSEGDALFLANYARNATESAQALVRNEKNSICSEYGLARSSVGVEEIGTMFSNYSQHVTSVVNEHYLSVYWGMTDTFPQNLYDVARKQIDSYVVHVSNVDPFMVAINETNEPLNFFDSFCQE